MKGLLALFDHSPLLGALVVVGLAAIPLVGFYIVRDGYREQQRRARRTFKACGLPWRNGL